MNWYRPAASPTALGNDHTQEWANLTGAVAWHPIDRHGEDWTDIGNKMETWGRARFGAAPEPIPAADVAQIKELWQAALADAAMYVEAHCVDGDCHAQHIMPLCENSPPLRMQCRRLSPRSGQPAFESPVLRKY